MALPLLSVLKALAPLIANASGIVAGLRATSNLRTEDRLIKLEQETLRAGEVLKGIAEQLQTIAQEMAVHAERAEASRRQARWLWGVAGVSAAAALTALSLVIGK